MATVKIFLPENAVLTVKEGDYLIVGQELVKAGGESTVAYDLLALFSLKAPLSQKDIDAIFIKKEGDEVVKGDILARKKGMLSTKMLKATFDGKVSRIDSVQGKIEVTPQDTEHEVIVSPVAGKIKKITRGEITIDFAGAVVFAKQGMGNMKKGVLAVVTKGAEAVLLSHITSEQQGKVLLGGNWQRQVLEKAFGLGALAILSTAIGEGDFAFFEESKLFESTLLVLSQADYDTLKGYNGKEVVVEGKHKRVIVV